MNYIIISNSYHIISEEINKITNNPTEIEYIDFQKSSFEEIVEEANYTSLFNDEKIIVIRNADFLGSKSSTKTDILEKYLSNPNPLSTLIFTYDDKPDERKKVIKLIKLSDNYVYVKPLTYKEVTDRIIADFKHNKYKISYDDANYITNKCLNNYDLVMMELKKIYLYYNEPTDIKRKDLENIISKYMDDNNFKFVDAVIKNDYKLSTKLLNDFKIQKVEPIALLSLLVREYRLMLFSKDLYKKGYSNKKIGEELSLQDWQVDKLIKNSYSYSLNDLEDKIIKLADLDLDIKSGKMDKYLGLELFALNN